MNPRHVKNKLSLSRRSFKWRMARLTFAFATLLTVSSLAQPAMAQQFTIYLGTSTSPLSQGIYRSTLDNLTGQLSVPELVAEAKNANFLAVNPNGRTLYSVLESDAAVASWAIGDDKKLTLLNTQPSGGSGPCHVWIDSTGKTVFVANYGGGSVSAFPVQEDGSLGASSSFSQHVGNGPHTRRQEKAHAHGIYTDPTNKFVYACDLGTDEVRIYRFDASKSTFVPAEMPAARVPAGGGPRHLAFGPNDTVYVNNELTLSITAFKRDSTTGALTEIQTISTIPEGASIKGVSTSEISVHPSGKWLYVSNRGRDTITHYNINTDGQLTWVEEVATPTEPRSFALSPNGEWLVVGGQKNNKVVSYRVDKASGRITPTGKEVTLGAPVCVLFAPAF
jgi:6-phosphogluconolactonase